MDAHLFSLFSNAAMPLLLNAKIGKIQEPAPGHLCIGFYNGGLRRNLYCRFGRGNPFCFISGERSAAPSRPGAQVMRLRKYCADRRISACVCQIFARKIWLMTGSEGAKSVWLCLDLAKGAQLQFLDQSETPEPDDACWPRPPELADALEHWRDWPVLTPLLRKTLQTLDQPEQWALMADLEDAQESRGFLFTYADSAGAISRASAWPLPAALRDGLAETGWDNPLEGLALAGRDIVLAEIYSRKEKEAAARLNRRERHLRNLLQTLERDEKKLLAMVEGGKTARVLAANLWRLDSQEKAASVHLPASADEPEQTLELPRPALSIAENMEKLFHNAKRGKRGLAMLEERRARLELELAELAPGDEAAGADPRPARRQAVVASAPRRTQAFLSSDGLAIWRGRDVSGNLAALRHASGHDIWAHVENGPGAHVIIRLPHPGYEVPERTLIEAGTLAANKSWLAEASTASVMYAEARHVHPMRRGPAGKVTIDKIRTTRITPVDMALESKLAAGRNQEQ